MGGLSLLSSLFLWDQTQSPLHHPLHYHDEMKDGQFYDSILCMATELVKITTWMNHQTDTWTEIVQIKWHLFHPLINHSVLWPLHYHSVDPYWIFRFPVSIFSGNIFFAIFLPQSIASKTFLWRSNPFFKLMPFSVLIFLFPFSFFPI